MPFTFAHPALVIPLLRQRARWPWLSATGLIMGSLAPDFEKLLRLRLVNGHSHTLASLFYFSLPLGLLLTFLWHGVVREPARRHLPAALHRRLAARAMPTWPAQLRQHPLGLAASVLLGAASHLLWDGFTHYNPWLTQYFPWLTLVVVLPGYRVYVYAFLALLSTVAGGGAIAWAVWQLPALPGGPPPPLAAVGRFWGAVLLLAAGLLGGWALATNPDHVALVIAAVAALLLALLLVSAAGSRWPKRWRHWLLGRARRRRRGRAATPA